MVIRMGNHHDMDNGPTAGHLSSVMVRPIRTEEIEQWWDLMDTHHYLGLDKRIAGERVLYVAEYKNRWVALLAWASAALHVGAREEWIGWDDVARRKRLNLVANNIRFLILPEVAIKNLASKVLSLNVARLSSDWEAFYGHPILLAETFVDPDRFHGTCYRAAGWRVVGKTLGFSRVPSVSGFYQSNEKPKTYFAMPLVKGFRETLSSQFYQDIRGREYFAMDIDVLPIEGKGGLIETLKAVSDPRQTQGRRHSNLCVLAISTCAMLSGARSFTAIWQWAKGLKPKQRDRLRCYRGKLPSQSTISRVLQRTDAQEFDDKVGNWLISATKDSSGQGIAVDGKVLCGSFGKDKKQVHLLSALLHQERIVVAQRKVQDKSNEITGFRPLLENIDLTDKVVTADAMHCQVNHAVFVVREKSGHFFFFVKENQPTLFALIEKTFADSNYAISGEATLHTKGHGRIEYREMVVKDWTCDLANQHTFPFIKQVCKVTRTWSQLDGTSPKSESRLCITSADKETVDAAHCLRFAVDHWSIENSSHYVRDETFDEDRSRIRKGNAPQVMATIRNLSIGVIRLAGENNIAAGVRYFQWGNKNNSLRAIGV